MKARKILIVDDEERMRRLVADFLRNEGFIPVEAGDGKEALARNTFSPERYYLAKRKTALSARAKR